MTENTSIKVYNHDKTQGYFTKFISSKERDELFSVNNHELMGPALRRANLFFRYRDCLVCIWEKWGSWFVLGDVLYFADLNPKSRGVDREACFQLLYHQSATQNKNVLGYYLNLPILFLEFKSHQLGYCHLQDLNKEYLVGSDAEEIRRAINFQNRELVYDIEEGLFSDSSDLKKESIQKLYLEFIQKQKKPHIGFLLAKPTDKIEDNEYCIKASVSGKNLAMISGFRNNSFFYVDRLAKSKDSRMSLDVLLASLYESLKKQGVTKVSLGLSSFYGEPEAFWAKFRKLILFWYDSEKLRSFKRKYSEVETPAYYFVEKRRSHFWQFIKLSLVSVYFKL